MESRLELCSWSTRRLLSRERCGLVSVYASSCVFRVWREGKVWQQWKKLLIIRKTNKIKQTYVGISRVIRNHQIFWPFWGDFAKTSVFGVLWVFISGKQRKGFVYVWVGVWLRGSDKTVLTTFYIRVFVYKISVEFVNNGRNHSNPFKRYLKNDITWTVLCCWNPITPNKIDNYKDRTN